MSYAKLNEVTGEKTYIVRALNTAFILRQRGILAPREARIIEELKRRNKR